MPAPDFLDTNVLVYAYDPGDPQKQRIAQDLVRKALAGEFLASTQVLAEFAATLLHKTVPPARPEDVTAVLDALGAEIQKSLSNKGAGAVTIPGLVKIEKKKVPARPAQKGVPNPFKPGELMDRPAKPAYNKVKVRALKLLKDMTK